MRSPDDPYEYTSKTLINYRGCTGIFPANARAGIAQEVRAEIRVLSRTLAAMAKG